MQDGIFVILILLGILTFVGTLFGFWLKRVLACQRDKDTLSATDLRLLQESVEALIERLTAASDEAVAEIERRQNSLQSLLGEVDAKLHEAGVRELDLGELRRMTDAGFAENDLARQAGMTRGEIELMLDLQAARSSR